MINWTAVLNSIRTELSDTWSSLSSTWLPALTEKEIKKLEEVGLSRLYDDSYYLGASQSAILTGGIATGKTHTITVGGGSGSLLTSGGAGGAGYILYGATGGGGGTGLGLSANSANSNLSVSGDAIISGELIVKGVSLTERLDTIEKRLAILNVNTKLEDKWKELKTLGDRYRELEKDILEKEEIWNIIKK